MEKVSVNKTPATLYMCSTQTHPYRHMYLPVYIHSGTNKHTEATRTQTRARAQTQRKYWENTA